MNARSLLARSWRGVFAVGILLTAAPVFGLHAQAADPAQPFLPAWHRLADRDGWQMLVSAAFPREWPPRAGRRMAVVRYVYAYRLRPGLADGAETAAPWARSTERPDGTVTVALLQPGLRPLGLQGVRPLRAGEAELARRDAEAAAQLRAGGSGASDGLVHDFTCNWIARNGVVAAALTPLHPAFVQSLACP